MLNSNKKRCVGSTMDVQIDVDDTAYSTKKMCNRFQFIANEFTTRYVDAHFGVHCAAVDWICLLGTLEGRSVGWPRVNTVVVKESTGFFLSHQLESIGD